VEVLEPFALYDAGASEDRACELAAAYGLGYVIRQQPGRTSSKREGSTRYAPTSARRRYSSTMPWAARSGTSSRSILRC
jgi:hypothetical protein